MRTGRHPQRLRRAQSLLERRRSECEREVRSPATKSPVAACEALERISERLFVKVRPKYVQEQQLCISRLPQQEVGQPNLARCSDQKVELGKFSGLKLTCNRLFVDRGGLQLTRSDLPGQLSSRGRDFRPGAIVQSNDK